MSLRGRRPWQSASPAVQSTARPQRGRKRTDCQKVNCPEGAREATLGCVGLCPPRNDAVILTRSFFCQCGPDTPGGVSLQASILVLLRRLEHHTAVTVGRSACGRPPTIHGGDWDDRKGRPYAKNPCGPASLRMFSLILHLQLQEQSFPGVQCQCDVIFIQLCPADGVAQDVALDAPCAHGTQGEGDGLLLRFR